MAFSKSFVITACAVMLACASDAPTLAGPTQNPPPGPPAPPTLDGAEGISYRAAGENIALTGGGASGALSLWLGSSGHRANIERCGYTHHGVGLVDSRWTHLFLEDPA